VPEEAVLDEQQEEAKAKKPKAKLGRSPLVKILLIVILALVSSASGGVISFYLISRSTTASAQQATEEQTETPEALEKAKQEAEQEKIAEMFEKGAVLPLEAFVVNLADVDAPRYLRIKVSLMVDDKSKIKELEENQALQLKVRDVILQSLTSKTSQDLINEEGKNKLRHEIQEKVTMYFHTAKLVDVMFTEFVIQL